ncbi:MAG: PAS domain S-box protein [Anaerolineales bacterium]
MIFQTNPYTIPLLLSGIVTLSLAIYAWKHRQNRAALPLAWVLTGMSIWTFSDALRWALVDIDAQIFWAKARFLGTDMLTVAFIALILQYVIVPRLSLRWVVMGMCALLAPTFILLLTNELHYQFWTSAEQVRVENYLALQRQNGIGYLLHMATNYAFLGLGLVALVVRFFRASNVLRGQTGAMIVATVIPLVANILSLPAFALVANLDLTPLSFTISGLALTFGVFRYGLMDVLPAARDAIIENLRDGVIVLDIQLRIVDLNPAAERILDTQLKNILGWHLDKFFPDWDFQDGISQGMDPFRERKLTLDTARGAFEPRISTLRSQEGAVTGYVIFLRDVSERKRAEADLRRSEEKYKSILEDIKEGYYQVDMQGNFVEVNDAFSNAVLFSRSVLLGNSFRQLADTHNGRRLLLLFNKVYKTGETIVQEDFEFTRNDGSKLFGAVSASLVRDENGNPIGYRGLVRDVTSRKLAEDALRASEEKYRTILEDIREGYYEMDLAGDFKEVNPIILEIVEMPYDEVIGKNFASFTEPESARQLFIIYHQLFRDRQPRKNIVYSITTPSGARKTLEASASVNENEKGKVIGFRGIVRDITEKQAREAQIRKLSQAVENSPTIVTITDRTGAIEYVNPKFEQVTGYVAAEVLGDNPRFLKAGDMSETTYYEMWETINGGKEWRGEFHNRKKNGDTFWVSSSISALLNDENEITHFIAVQEDITERKAYESELAKARDAAESANQAKSSFLANMSHELRTPLNAIIGYSEILLEDAEDEGRDDMAPDLQKIRAAGKHLLTLINDILDLSKIEAGKMDLFIEQVDLVALVDEVRGMILPLVEKNGNRFDVKIDPDLQSMQTDQTKVRQALFNLLSNASKFTSRGVVSLDVEKVRESGDTGAGWAMFRVRDTGIGMNEEQIQKLFQPFTQADASTTRKYGGTGLGLTITQRFCQLMGGRITVESEPGVGSQFTIWLPLEAREPELEEIPKPVPVEQSAGTVLVIDDDAHAREMMARHLAREGYVVHLATGGREGLEMARSLKPDLITLDVLMPGMDGWDVLTELKADAELANIPVAIVSMIENRNLGFSLGATDYLMKPVDRRKVARMVAPYRKNQGETRVLVIDDEPNIREQLQRVLSKEGYAVDTAENGKVGLERLFEQRPDLILLDLMMPEMDGFEFVMVMRTQQDWGKIPVVVLTARDVSAEERAILNGNVQKVMQKSAYEMDVLLKELRLLGKGLNAEKHHE